VDYTEFISSKQRRPKSFGFEPDQLNNHLKDFQRKIVDWAVKRGRAAIFADCGLGKTLMQLEWANQICKHTGGRVVLHCPVGVRRQTLQEASKFCIDSEVVMADSMDQVGDAISLVNYEKLHKIDTSKFVGVVLDESSILKNFTGKIKRQLIECWSHVNYKLACTATPAPNDYMELGNHADFLGIMPSNEMLSRWFINDTMKAGGYRLKGHAQDDFWDWISTWAVCIAKPSDIGCSDDGYDLPELIEHVHVVSDEDAEVAEGFLFNNFALSATNVHRQKKTTASIRAAKVADLVASEPGPWLIWCDTDYEADELKDAIEDAVEVRGSDKRKEEKLLGFANGEFDVLVTKPKIAGMGMNYQHCKNVAFVGLSYSFEAYYQGVRRCWRFGQKNPVHVHLVESDGESALRRATMEKQAKFKQMQIGMSEAVKDMQVSDELKRETYLPEKEIEVPEWL
jgi:hypothetical protein